MTQPFLRLAVPALMAFALAAPSQAADVGVTVEISRPGVYGRVDIGRYPQPAVVLPQPVIIRPAPRPVAAQPVYLWVPPGHQKKWSKHCARYNACGVPVYFVQEGWYRQHVAGGGSQAAAGGHGREGEGHDRRESRDRDDRGGDRGHPGRGHGRGQGNGNGNGRD